MAGMNDERRSGDLCIFRVEIPLDLPPTGPVRELEGLVERVIRAGLAIEDIASPKPMAVRAVFDHTEPLELALDDRAMRAELGDDEALVTAVRYLGAAMQLIQRAFELADVRTVMEEFDPDSDRLVTMKQADDLRSDVYAGPAVTATDYVERLAVVIVVRAMAVTGADLDLNRLIGKAADLLPELSALPDPERE